MAGFSGKATLLVCLLEVSVALRTLPSLVRADAPLLFPGERSVGRIFLTKKSFSANVSCHSLSDNLIRKS